MSLAQFPAFPRPTPSLQRSSPPISSPSQQMTPATSVSAPHPPRGCCENGRPILTDPHTGQTVCSCQYPGGLPLTYPRNPTAALPPGLESVYNASAYAAAGYVALGSEGSAFYSPLGSGPFDLKESAEAWRTLAATQPGFPYDPMAVYPYGPGKNATRENTNTLKAWLYEHRKNPYPTKGEKIMLAIITKMTLTQVSTWFANARRRLKKENKMTWSPRNRSEDGSDDIDNPDDDDDCTDGRNRSVVMSPSDQHELDITSSKPSSPILSSDSNHNNNRPFKERIIRVDEDDDEDEDCDVDDVHDDDDDDRNNAISRLNSFRFRHLEELQRRGDNNLKATPLILSRDMDRDRSPLRSFSDSDATDDNVLSRVRGVASAATTGLSEVDRPCRTSSSTNRGDNSDACPGSPKSPCSTSSHPTPLRTNSPSDNKSCPPSPTQPRTQQQQQQLPPPSSSSSSSSQQQPPQQPAPPTTRPKIWSISDVINTSSSSSSSSSSTSSSSTSSTSNSSIISSIHSSSNPLLPSSLLLSPSSSSPSSLTTVPSLSSLSSPLSLNRHHPFLPHSSSSSSAPRPIPNPGFLFLPHAPAHWQAAAARFAGMGGAYPLSLAHSTLSYPYNLANPNAVRAGLEAHAQSVAQLARATAEGNAAAASIAAAAAAAASRGIDSRDGEKISLVGLPRHPNGALMSSGRDVDAMRSHGMGPPRMIVDTSLQ